MATTFVCPKGDQSDDPEFCSVCGTRIDSTASAVVSAATATSASTSTERCPTCGIERKPGARFCETCRYDFKAQAAGPPPTPTMTAPPPTPDPGVAVDPVMVAPAAPVDPVAAPAPTQTTAQARYWEALVAVDPTLDVEPDPDVPYPTDTTERTFPLDLPENLIGRRSASRGILPQISLNDPGVSHRHAMIYRNPDGSLMVSDLGSTNGTILNGAAPPLEPGVKTPITDGDQLELGRWTRITLRQHA